MTFKSKILVSIFMIVSFDAIGSTLSRLFQFDYGDFIWGSFLLYVFVGYWGAYRRGFIYGILLGGVTGLAESTLGWYVSTAIGPFTRRDPPNSTLSEILIAIIFVSAIGIVLGLLGAGICKILGQIKSNPKS